MNDEVKESNNYGPLFNRNSSGAQKNNRQGRNEFVEDLEDSMPGVIPTVSNQVSNHIAMSNGHLGGKQQNGRPPNFRSMLEDAELDSHI